MKKDESLIPEGPYCYTPQKGRAARCPYHTTKEINGVHVPYCSFLEMGGLDNDMEDSEFNKLVEHYGGDDEVFEALPLDLLWDQVKECGENDDIEDNIPYGLDSGPQSDDPDKRWFVPK
jgi:hypothetical protein